MLHLIKNSKVCHTCEEEKSITLFGKNKQKKDGYDYHCKDCRNAKAKIERKLYPEKKHQEYQRHKNTYRKNGLLRKFGIDLEYYNTLFNSQNGKCKCCGTHQSELKLSLAVDHCHTTGKIRGLLCGNCNTALGLVKDNTEVLKSMIQYLGATST